MPRKLSLPTFKLSRGELIETPDTRSTIKHGFIIQETHSKTGKRLDIAKQHLSAALIILTTKYPKVDFTNHWESYRGTYYGTGRHIDGLAYRYWQLHHTHYPTDDNKILMPRYASRSGVTIDYFKADEGEHKAMQDLYKRLRKPSSNPYIGFHPTKQESNYRKNIPPNIFRHDPTRRVSLELDWNSTLVFPNGYDATANSKPQDLYVHHFHSIDESGKQIDAPRMVSAASIIG